MNTYDMFCEKDYIESKIRAIESSRDVQWRRSAVHQYKEIVGSTLRKAMEENVLWKGKILDVEKIRTFLPEDLKNGTYTIRYLACFLEAYNDDTAYQKREMPIRKWKRFNDVKKHLNSYLRSGAKELRQYKQLYIDNGDLDRYDGIKRALLIFSTIIKVYSIRKTPGRISLYLYEKCKQVDDDFETIFCVKDGYAYFVRSELNKSYLFLRNFNDDIKWLFILHFLKLDRR